MDPQTWKEDKIALIILEEGGLPEKHPSVGITAGKVLMCLSVFAKRKTWTGRIHFIPGFLHLNLIITMENNFCKHLVNSYKFKVIHTNLNTIIHV